MNSDRSKGSFVGCVHHGDEQEGFNTLRKELVRYGHMKSDVSYENPNGVFRDSVYELWQCAWRVLMRNGEVLEIECLGDC